MRLTFTFILIAVSFVSYAQFYDYDGTDSTKSIGWNDLIRYLDTEGNTAIYTRYTYNFSTSFKTIFIKCGDTTSYINTQTIPECCVIYYSVDSYPENINIDMPSGYYDSLYFDTLMLPYIDNDCVEEYYQTHKDSLKIDTIYLKNDKVYNRSSLTETLLSECQYFYQLKDGKEVVYYTHSDLHGVCVKKNFRIKSKGRWYQGEKHGIWREYNPDGTLAVKRKYRHGELIWERRK